MESYSSDSGSSGEDPGRGKPRIWAAGRQRPPFELRAFLRVSALNSRALASPALLAVARGLDRIGRRVEDGEIRIPPHRLGRTGRFLPSHTSTGRCLRDSAAMTRLAAQAAGGPAPVEPMPFRSWTAPAPMAAPIPAPAPVPAVAAATAPAPAAVVPAAAPPSPVQRPSRPAPLPKAPEADADRDTLEAIRSLMAMTVVEPQHPVRAAKAPPPPPPLSGVEALPELAPAEPAPRGNLFKLAGRLMGVGMVGLAFPLGMAKASYAFARGEDLRLAQ